MHSSLHYTVTHFPPIGIPSWPSLSTSRAPYCCMVCSKLVASRGPEYFLHCRAEGKCAPHIPCLSPFRLPSGSQPDHRHWHCELLPACSVALHTAYTIHSEKCTIYCYKIIYLAAHSSLLWQLVMYFCVHNCMSPSG